MKGGPQRRVSSPSGLSTLTTSAPRSASTCPAHGPARIRASSTTLSPASGAITRRPRTRSAQSVAQARGHLAAVPGELVHDLAMQPDVVLGRPGIVGTAQLFGQLLAL